MSTKGRRIERTGEAPRKPTRAIKLTVAYDGTHFGGAQRQPGSRTIQGELERAIQEVCGLEVPAYLAGRTDQGVHAAGQVASFADYRPELKDGIMFRALNAHLPDDLSVLRAERRPLGFHARYDARWREYRYRIWVGPKHPLAALHAWHRESPLVTRSMAEAAAKLVGTHDVATFAGGGEGVPWSARQRETRGTVRTIYACSVRTIEPWWGRRDDGTMIEIRIVADGFLPRMVRGIVGALVEIGRGARPVTWIDELLAGKDRRLGPMNAPAHGLTLWQVGYDGDLLEDAALQPGQTGRISGGSNGGGTTDVLA